MAEHPALAAVQVRRGDPDKVAVLLPGRAYPVSAPLLYYTSLLLVRRGWTVHEARWQAAPPGTPGEVEQLSRSLLERLTARHRLLVAKSLGCYAVPVAAELGVPGVWLTPVLDDLALAEQVRRLPAPGLLVGGTADPMWRADPARASALRVHEVPGGDHGLVVGGDEQASVLALQRVLAAIDAFLDTLPG